MTPGPSLRISPVICTPLISAALALGTGLSGCAEQDPGREGRDPVPETREPSDPPPRFAVAGIKGFTAVSDIVYAEAPDRPHRLEAIYVFPGRTRWWLSDVTPGAARRSVEYRYGSKLYKVGGATEESTPYEGGSRDLMLRQMELRRATLFWPDGLDWEERDGDMRASVGGVEGGPLGHVVATVGDGERPSSFTMFDAEGIAKESLDVLEWNEVDGRAWPRRLRFRVGDQVVWNETVRAIDVRTRYLDSFFVPTDRRDAPGGTTDTSVVETTELPVLRLKRVPLASKSDWAQAQRTAEKELASESTRLGGDLDPVARFAIDANGTPTHVLLALSTTSRDRAGYELLESRSGLMLVLDDLTHLNRSVVRRLLDALPPGTRPAPVYVRRTRSYVQVVLPLVPED